MTRRRPVLRVTAGRWCILCLLLMAGDRPVVIDRRYQKKPDAAYCRAMRVYSRRHYAIDRCRLSKPRLIILHCAYAPTVTSVVNTFRGSTVEQSRGLARGGRVNVGAHFIVDRRGRIYSCVPVSHAARHAVGLNYTAVGIENVARRNAGLTPAQVRANIRLVLYLRRRLPSLRYLLGHHEYNDPDRAHYRFVRCRDQSYRQWPKTDPGPAFMRAVRAGLKAAGVVMED